MNDYIYIEWLERNNYAYIANFNKFSNLRFIIDFFENDYKREDQTIFVQALNVYDKTFVYNDLEHNVFYVGCALWKWDGNIETPSKVLFSDYVNEINSCKISHKNFIKLAENLIRIKANPTPYIVIYRNEDWISCKGFSSQEEIELFTQDFYEGLPLVRRKINNIFLSMKNCSDVTQANTYFQQLDTINSYLSILVFSEEVDVPSDLYQFIRDFDRIDDASERQYMFNKITKENYSLKGQSIVDKLLVKSFVDIHFYKKIKIKRFLIKSFIVIIFIIIILFSIHFL